MKKKNLNTIISLIALIVSVWALVIAYQAKALSEWVDDKQENLIEKTLFNASTTLEYESTRK